MIVRPAGPRDADAIWALLEPVFRAGETYAIDRAIGREAALGYWLGADRQTFVAEADGRVAGTYYLRANQPGGGAHVANCGYVSGVRGTATAMAEHSFDAARAAGFRAMQFNFVVSTNARAVALWQRLGFATVGRLPRAFDHPVHGMVDALVLFRDL